jgi:hypothetical protein
MTNVLRAQALIGLIGAASLGCSSSGPNFLPSGAEAPPSASATNAAPRSPGQKEVATAQPPAHAVSYAEIAPITSADVIRWTARGVRDDIIIDRVERSPSIFHLTAADENRLHDKGVSEAVILEMKATAQR